MKLLNVGIYLRLSNEDHDKLQTWEDSESIKNQRHLLLEEISRHPEFILYDEYCDEDLSGAGTYRPQFERLIKDCSQGKIDVVLCKSQSRFSRDMEIIEKYLHNKFIEWNVRFISLADHADTENRGNKKARQINGLVNEWYLEDVSNNIRSAFQAKMKQGEFISPFASYGYLVSSTNNNQLVVDPIASKVVQKIFHLYLSGLGYTGIANYLNEHHIPSPSLYKYQQGSKLNIQSNRPRTAIKWSSNAIKTILSNELYIGNLIQGKRTTLSYKNHKIKRKDKKEWIKVLHTHEAIIDEITFKKVQALQKERTRSIKKTGKVHLFSGKVFCLECHHSMRKKDSSLHSYLVCSSNQNGYDICINKSSIRYDQLEKIILEEIQKKIKDYFDIEAWNTLVQQRKFPFFQKKIVLLEKQKEKLQQTLEKNQIYLRNLYEDHIQGTITIEQFRSLLSIYDSVEIRTKEELNHVLQTITDYQNKENDFKKDFSVPSIKTLDQVIVDTFISKIYIGKIDSIHQTRVVQIEWNFNSCL